MCKFLKNVAKNVAVALGLAGVTAASALAQSTPLGDFATSIASEGSTIAGVMATVAAGALVIFVLIVGVRLCVRIFKSIK